MRPSVPPPAFSYLRELWFLTPTYLETLTVFVEAPLSICSRGEAPTEIHTSVHNHQPIHMNGQHVLLLI